MAQAIDCLDIMARVFAHLSPQEALRAGEVCKLWHAASREPLVWQAQAKDVFAPGAVARSLPAAPQPAAPGTAALGAPAAVGHAAMPSDPYAAFVARWQSSKQAAQTLMDQPNTRHRSVPDLARATTGMARPHRLAVARYILQRVEMGMGLRLDRRSVVSGVERAATCADPRDARSIARQGADIVGRLLAKSIANKL